MRTSRRTSLLAKNANNMQKRIFGQPPRRNGRALAILITSLVVILAGGYGLSRLLNGAKSALKDEIVLGTVRVGPFDHIVREQGEVESSSNIDVICEVKSRNGGSGGTPILWVIEEGSYVKKGDKLVELDSSQLENELAAQNNIVSNAGALVISSEAAHKTALIALEEYIQGTYLQERSLIESEIFVAKQGLFKAEQDLASAQRLGAKGVVKKLQIQSEEFAVENARNILAAAESKLEVLDKYTKAKFEVQLMSDIETAKARLSSDKSVLDEEVVKLKEISDQLAKCIILSPADGVVVHNNAFSSRGGAEFVVEEGAMVRGRQTIIKLPDPTKMQVKAKVNESHITLIRENMPAKVRVTAAPKEMLAKVIRVNKYAEPGSWFSSSVKEYATIIEILNPPDVIRTGMTAEVQIFVEQIPDALQIPVNGLYEFKGHHFCLRSDGKKFETVEVTIGATNSTEVTIVDGLAEGDRIVLDPRRHLDLMDFPDIEEVTDREEMAEMAKDISDTPVVIDGPGESAGGPGGGGGFDPSAIVDRIFSTADTNNDGQIDATEKGSLSGNMASNFDKVDADGDGSVTKAEMTKAMSAMGGGRGGAGGGGGGRGPGGGGGGRGPGAGAGGGRPQ